jgi:hypothetical protein|tara:strand:- start:459 stop:644 length:186 start_codon:yes stop_codon:yes gene_type:complete
MLFMLLVVVDLDLVQLLVDQVVLVVQELTLLAEKVVQDDETPDLAVALVVDMGDLEDLVSL